MNDKMRILKNTFLVAAVLSVSSVSAQNASGEFKDEFKDRIAERTIDGAEIGSLMCENSEGKLVVCSGDEFEKVLGFATSVPYITVNKRPKGESQDMYDAFASMEGGSINTNDYLCPAEGGKLMRCDQADNPYAKSLSNAAADGQMVSVRVLGSRR